ncbi:MAG TPA: Do family serine endopeptidase [Allosphingosinicella sp.]|nr:Do family serine endopeptidase [Allosphingosinicella sp.]
MRYVYGITAALLLGGTVATLSNPVGAQVAQNEPGTISAAAPRAGAPMSFADLVARLQPAVVNISTRQAITAPQGGRMPPGFEEFFRRFGREVPQGGDQNVTQRGNSLGSGFIVSADGYIVTNNHVVAPTRDNAVVEAITVTLNDGSELPAEIVGRDTLSDLAVLRVRPRGALPFVRFGDSRQTRVGDWVIAIGNPFMLGGTVTAGIVSALHRNIGAGNYDRYIQTDAPINSGNSGGPMFDLQGNVIGINTALISPTGGNVGIGFAIPAEQARPIVETLMRGERVRRGYLGVALQSVSDAGVAEALGIERNRGELIRSVSPGGPAARAGLQQGDVVMSVNNQPVTPEQTASYLISTLPVGSRVPFEILRDGQRRAVTVTLAERPTEEELGRLNQNQEGGPAAAPPGGTKEAQSSGQRSTREGLGLTVQTLTADVARELRLDPSLRGVVVTAVDSNSDAAVKNLQPGDVILSIDNRPTRTPEEAAAAVAAARQARRRTVLLLVRRGNQPPLYIGVQIAAAR